MLNIHIICVGKVKENFLKDALNEYTKRLLKYCKIDFIELPDEKIPEKLNPNLELEIKEKEGKQILSHLPLKSYKIVLDLKGKEFSSEEFSQKLDEISMENSHVSFIIGGSLGLSNEVLDSCDLKVCFSKMTFPHQLIRVFLLEQVFRAFKISHGETYHR